jgi:hypothetical protein
MMFAAIALALLAPVTAPAQDHSSGRVERILKSGDGKTAETAYQVKSVAEEYQVIRALGLAPQEQALILKDDKAYDLMTVVDPKTGNKVELWFDISSFFGKGF